MARDRAVRLSQSQTIKLYNWLSENKNDLKHMTGVDIATTAGKILGFPVAVSAARSIAKEAGVLVEQPSRSATGSTKILAAILLDIVTQLDDKSPHIETLKNLIDN